MFDIPKAIPIKKIITETPFVKTFVFEHALNSKPGQFVNLWIPRVDEKPMSIAFDNGKEFWVTMFAVGNFSKKMHTLKVGDLVGVRGPYGTHFTGPGGGAFKKGQHLVMMGGGYGAAPLYNLTVAAVKAGCKVDFVIGARSKEHLLYIDRIKKLKNVKLFIATDDGSVGLKGYNTMILERLIKEHKAKKGSRISCVYTCGPEVMMKRISDMCFAAKIPAQVSIERYMKCGFGVCGQCCVDPTGERMCKSGPVVNNAKARKITEFGKYHRDLVGKIQKF
ncbi:MAG: dihydroorotate dehydrogenase electron transfer subunit [Candidatus Gracilibacteria bacterium]|jgi:dihydroorotate dehydrogenase electron transfer subunit